MSIHTSAQIFLKLPQNIVSFFGGSKWLRRGISNLNNDNPLLGRLHLKRWESVDESEWLLILLQLLNHTQSAHVGLFTQLKYTVLNAHIFHLISKTVLNWIFPSFLFVEKTWPAYLHVFIILHTVHCRPDVFFLITPGVRTGKSFLRATGKVKSSSNGNFIYRTASRSMDRFADMRSVCMFPQSSPALIHLCSDWTKTKFLSKSQNTETEWDWEICFHGNYTVSLAWLHSMCVIPIRQNTVLVCVCVSRKILFFISAWRKESYGRQNEYYNVLSASCCCWTFSELQPICDGFVL